VTAPEDLATVRQALVDAGVELESAEIAMQPKSTVDVPEDQVAQLMRLMDALEEHDDVSAVHANFNVDAGLLERVAG
jgi:transcriptional/translational regulatory protein YebC/TACO1